MRSFEASPKQPMPHAPIWCQADIYACSKNDPRAVGGMSANSASLRWHETSTTLTPGAGAHVEVTAGVSWEVWMSLWIQFIRKGNRSLSGLLASRCSRGRIIGGSREVMRLREMSNPALTKSPAKTTTSFSVTPMEPTARDRKSCGYRILCSRRHQRVVGVVDVINHDDTSDMCRIASARRLHDRRLQLVSPALRTWQQPCCGAANGR